MTLVHCSDCQLAVSSEAPSCVHCGKPLYRHGPGVIGIAVRVVYWAFTILVWGVGIFVLIAAFRARDGFGIRDAILFTPAIWLAGSVAAAVLLYVTRRERSRAIEGATTRPVRNP